jgi:hypothetical protein
LIAPAEGDQNYGAIFQQENRNVSFWGGFSSKGIKLWRERAE